jgi:hypothetical protein
MPSLSKYFTIVGAVLLGLLIVANSLLEPDGPAPSVVKATPKVIVQHDPQASLVERLRNEEAAQKAAAKGESPAGQLPVTQRDKPVTLPAAPAQAEPVQLPAAAPVTTATPTEDATARLARKKIKAQRVRKQRLARERAQAEQAASRRQDQLYHGYAPAPTYGPFGGWGQAPR